MELLSDIGGGSDIEFGGASRGSYDVVVGGGSIDSGGAEGNNEGG